MSIIAQVRALAHRHKQILYTQPACQEKPATLHSNKQSKAEQRQKQESDPTTKRHQDIVVLRLGSMVGSGDGWAAGPNKTQLWGKYGAAGLLLFTPRTLLLQHRAPWTSQGGTWALPGGARDAQETAEQAAAREAFEETGIAPDNYQILEALRTAGPYPADPLRPELAGGWSYTTVLAYSPEELVTQANAESQELAWIPFEEVERYPLLPAFAQSWKAHFGAYGLREYIASMLEKF